MRGTRLCTALTSDDFLCFNGPTGITVEPNDTRGNFFLHLGLKETNFRHRQIYNRMKQEATAGMERLFKSRKSLQPELMDDASVRPPFSLTQITETAFQRQVEKIYRLASSQTRGIYDLTKTEHAGNWVIRWMLWRVVQARQRQHQRRLARHRRLHDSPMSVNSDVRTSNTKIDSPLSTFSPHHPFEDEDDDEDDDNSEADDWWQGEMKPEREMRARAAKAHRRSRYWEHVLNG